ncbi:hypothetical protein ON010_g18581 [Phytophthora cinnamomi]|nr:hypothetical protein ON010_g18581 [Phytophthora cinnamomi]
MLKRREDHHSDTKFGLGSHYSFLAGKGGDGAERQGEGAAARAAAQRLAAAVQCEWPERTHVQRGDAVDGALRTRREPPVSAAQQALPDRLPIPPHGEDQGAAVGNGHHYPGPAGSKQGADAVVVVVRCSLCQREVQFFNQYDQLLTDYMADFELDLSAVRPSKLHSPLASVRALILGIVFAWLAGSEAAQGLVCGGARAARLRRGDDRERACELGGALAALPAPRGRGAAHPPGAARADQALRTSMALFTYAAVFCVRFIRSHYALHRRAAGRAACPAFVQLNNPSSL